MGALESIVRIVKDHLPIQELESMKENYTDVAKSINEAARFLSMSIKAVR
jgi:hypothetical protein